MSVCLSFGLNTKISVTIKARIICQHIKYILEFYHAAFRFDKSITIQLHAYLVLIIYHSLISESLVANG